MASVGQWTGREARALRRALRLSVRKFATHVSVGARTVANWEAMGADTQPKPDSQALLDRALARADAEVQTRFAHLLEGDGGEPAGFRLATRLSASERETWEDDLDRVVVGLSRQSFDIAERLLNRWLVRYDPGELDERGRYLHARSVTLLGDLRRDRGEIRGLTSAQQSYHRALTLFDDLDIPRRRAQIELSLAVVTEMSNRLDTAAHHYQELAVDERLSDRDRARAQLWIGTALDKTGQHQPAAWHMLTAVRAFEALDEPDDWSVAHQKLALAYRGVGDLDRALHYIEIARANATGDTPMQRVRLDTAQAHILLSDKQTRDNGFALLDQARALSEQRGLAHQLVSITNIRQAIENTA